MGRTVPSLRLLLEKKIAELSVFRRALHGEDKAAIDSLMNMARKHTSSSTITPTLDPMDAVFLSILIEQQKEIIIIHCGRRKQMFLLDVNYNPKNATITKWIKDGKGCKPVCEVFYPKISFSDKPEFLHLIASLPYIKDMSQY